MCGRRFARPPGIFCAATRSRAPRPGMDRGSPDWWRTGRARGTVWASASGEPSAARAPDRTTNTSSRRTIREPRSSACTERESGMSVSRSASERLRLGIIGGGAITQVAHLPVLKKLRTIEVQRICDTDLPKARALATRFGVKDAFDDIEELLRFESLDAVVICSPNHLHEAQIQAALSANLHVLVEKPLTMNATSA